MSEIRDQEEWKPVVGYEGLYEVSDRGRVLSLHRDQLLAPTPHGAYPGVTLCGRGREKRAKVHVLMLEAFVGPRPEGMVGRHLNDQKSDNRIANLEWGTPAQNREDARRNQESRRVTWTEFHAGRK